MASISINTEALRSAAATATGSLGAVDQTLSAIEVARNKAEPISAVTPELDREFIIAHHSLIELGRKREDLLKLRNRVESDPTVWDRLGKMGYSQDEDPLRLLGFELDEDTLSDFGFTALKSVPGPVGYLANTLSVIESVDEYNSAKANGYVRYSGPLANGLDS